MTHDELDKRVSAYVDGALRGAKREQLEREMDTDARLAGQVQRSRALGKLVRAAWTEGPAAPSPDFLLAAIRPALAEIDRERSARPAWQRRVDSAFARLGAALRPSPVFATAAAFAFVLALTVLPRLDIGTAVQTNFAGPAAQTPVEGSSVSGQRTAMPAEPIVPSSQAGFTADGPDGVYYVWPDRPAVLLHTPDGSNTLWLIDDGDLSLRLHSARRWG